MLVEGRQMVGRPSATYGHGPSKHGTEIKMAGCDRKRAWGDDGVGMVQMVGGGADGRVSMDGLSIVAETQRTGLEVNNIAM